MARRLQIERIIFPDRSSNFKHNYLVNLKAKKDESQTIFSQSELEKAYEDIQDILGYNYSNNLSEKEIDEIVSFQNKNPKLCFSCDFRMKECTRCVHVCESPIERKLFLALLEVGLNPELQVWIAKNGEKYPRTSNFSPRDCLTRPDFYFEGDDYKLCIYTDGFTYHNQSEEKVSKDQHINRELQNHGYKFMRFPGKDIRENLSKVIEQITQFVT